MHPGATATETEEGNVEKYRELIDNGYFFQPVVMEVQDSLGGVYAFDLIAWV